LASPIPDRVAEHVAAFNAAARTGDWGSFAERFTPAAVMRFTGVPAGPFTGREAIARAYAEQPPTDTRAVREVASAGSGTPSGSAGAAAGPGSCGSPGRTG
jgi:steroid Delta-isomerase